MSWLYSLVFAGLLFSSNNGTVDSIKEIQVSVPPAIEVIAALPDETEKFEQTYSITPNGRVSVSNVNGSIVVEAWARNEVRLEATKIADTREALSDVEIKVDSRADSFSVEADYGGWKLARDKGWKNHRKLEVQFRLWVPRTAVLDQIGTVNGSVSVSNMTNITKVSAVNGEVKATNLRGMASLETVNGTVEADFDRLDTGSKISLETVNGRVNLVIPSDANATIKAESLNGIITNDFGLPIRKGKYVGRDMYGRVGSGDVQIRLESVNGGLSVGRKNDGRTTNPATDLLPQKNKDEEDRDDNDENGVAVSLPRMNRDIVRAVKDAENHASIGLKEAQKEINKMKPEIAKIARESFKMSAEAISQTAVVLNSEELNKTIKEAIKLQNEALSRIDFANFNLGTPFIEKKTKSFPVKGTPKVVIEAKGCGVRVRGWDKPEVSYSLVKMSRNNQKPQNRDSSVSVRNTDSEVNIKVSQETMSGGIIFNDATKVRLEVFVPKKSNLKIVTDGEIRLEGVSGDIKLDGEDEAINVRDVDGQLRLSSAEGQVRVIGFKGEFDSTTTEGDVFLEGDFEKLSAKATSGTVTLTMPDNVNASFTSNTQIKAEGVNMSRENDQTWRIGTGGAKYNFNFTDGKLIIRNASIVNSY